jgi:hypothetical protein
MTESSRYAKHSDRWANELWNVSLLPVAAANENDDSLRKLENLDERRRRESFLRPLTVSQLRPSGTLG